jgi:hypothetical protein
MEGKLIKTRTGSALRKVKSPAKPGTIKIARIRAAVNAVLKKLDKKELMKIKVG